MRIQNIPWNRFTVVPPYWQKLLMFEEYQSNMISCKNYHEHNMNFMIIFAFCFTIGKVKGGQHSQNVRLGLGITTSFQAPYFGNARRLQFYTTILNLGKLQMTPITIWYIFSSGTTKLSYLFFFSHKRHGKIQSYGLTNQLTN